MQNRKPHSQKAPQTVSYTHLDVYKRQGVEFECNMVIGKVLTIDELMDEYGYEAVFVGSGAGLPRFMGIPGESLKGVYSANEFLTRSNPVSYTHLDVYKRQRRHRAVPDDGRSLQGL